MDLRCCFWECELVKKKQIMGTSGKNCCKGHMAALCRAWTKLATRRSNDPGCRWCFHQPNSKWTPFHLFWWYWNQHLEGNLHNSKGKARRVERVYQAVKECQRTRSESDVVIFFRVLFRFQEKQIASLRMIPTMTFIHFLTGKSSGILSDISSGILSGICSGISSGILSGKSSGILSGISSGILSDILLTFLLAFYLAYLLTFYLTYLLTFFLAYLLTFCLAWLSSDILSDILSGILSGISSDILSDIFSDILPVEVRQCPLRSGSRGWGPAVPTAIWKSRLRSGSAHWDLELAVEVRQCPLGSGARGWGPAVPTATWKSRLRSGSTHCDLQLAVEVRQCPLGSAARGGGPAVPTGIWTARRRRRVRRRRRRTALIKFNNPHLAGGEPNHQSFTILYPLKDHFPAPSWSQLKVTYVQSSYVTYLGIWHHSPWGGTSRTTNSFDVYLGGKWLKWVIFIYIYIHYIYTSWMS